MAPNSATSSRPWVAIARCIIDNSHSCAMVTAIEEYWKYKWEENIVRLFQIGRSTMWKKINITNLKWGSNYRDEQLATLTSIISSNQSKWKYHRKHKLELAICIWILEKNKVNISDTCFTETKCHSNRSNRMWFSGKQRLKSSSYRRSVCILAFVVLGKFDL